MKKLALITPKGVYFSNDPILSQFFKAYQTTTARNLLMPKYEYWSGGGLGLLIVAALTPSGFDIEYIDENHEEINFDAGYDLVGISAMTQQATRAYEIADEFRSRGVKVVIGGIHATVLPDEAKAHADSVVIGEAENTWPEFAKDFIRDDIKPFYKSASPVDLTKSPVPKYELLKKYDYKMIWVQTTRGCPRDCEFCCASSIYGRTYRHKTIGQVLYEINHIRGLWDEPLINFADDNMFVDRAYSYELVRRLGQTGLRWAASTDISIADNDDIFFKFLRNSGCILIFIGFEALAADRKIDDHGWKQGRVLSYSTVINKIQAQGIIVYGSFILGLDGDDASIFDRLIKFITENHLYASQISILTPLPGTKLRERLMVNNRILSNDWRKYTFKDVVFQPQKLTPEELKNGIIKLYREIYSMDVRGAVIKHFLKIFERLFAQGDKLYASGKFI